MAFTATQNNGILQSVNKKGKLYDLTYAWNFKQSNSEKLREWWYWGPKQRGKWDDAHQSIEVFIMQNEWVIPEVQSASQFTIVKFSGTCLSLAKMKRL